VQKLVLQLKKQAGMKGEIALEASNTFLLILHDKKISIFANWGQFVS